jgi:DNA-binding IclR family transcriptional regulator
MLACLPDSDLEARLGKLNKLTPSTSSTITSRTQLRAEIEKVRMTGVAENHGEFADGVGALGAAIRGPGRQPAAAVSVAFPMLEGQDQLWNLLPDRILSVANTMQARLESAEH